MRKTKRTLGGLFVIIGLIFANQLNALAVEGNASRKDVELKRRIAIAETEARAFNRAHPSGHASVKVFYPVNRAQRICVGIQKVDWAHISGYAKDRTANVHGWWEVSSGCSASVKGKVTVWLKKSVSGKPTTLKVASGIKQAKTFNTYNYRVAAPKACSGFASNWFYGVVDVDLIGYYDSPGTNSSPKKKLSCTV